MYFFADLQQRSLGKQLRRIITSKTKLDCHYIRIPGEYNSIKILNFGICICQ